MQYQPRAGGISLRACMGMLLSAASLAAIAVPSASAQQAGATSFDIPAGDVAPALRAFSDQTGLQMVFSTPSVEGIRTNGVQGAHGATEALAILLAGTGLSYRISDNRTVTIYAAATSGADGERVLGAVRVEGDQGSPYFGGAGQSAGINGVNGSRDITATEGTGSFTSGALTIGSKVAQALKDVPQSVSVLTSERMKQQNVTDFKSALTQLPGIAVIQNDDSVQSSFFSRGFAINSISTDGGASFVSTTSTGDGSQIFFPQIDMSQYDHVELLRGAAGTFNGYGDPGGTINLVRKKPLDHPQLLVDAQVGSWNNYRAVIDGTTPIAFDGRLRTRLVLTFQDNDHFYKIAHDRKELVYNINQLDLTPTTLITAGVSISHQANLPWVGGLPRYIDGGFINLPRSTCLCLKWNRENYDTTEIFGGIEQKISSDWTAKVNVTYNRQKSFIRYGSVSGTTDRNNLLRSYIYGVYQDYGSKMLTADASVSGGFNIFGQRQEIVVGVNRGDSNGDGRVYYDDPLFTYNNPYQPDPSGPVYCIDYGAGICPPGSNSNYYYAPVDIMNFNPDRYRQPANSLASKRVPANQNTSTVYYANLRLTAFDRLHLVTSIRYSTFHVKSVVERLCKVIPTSGTPTSDNCVGRKIGDPYARTSTEYSAGEWAWPPSVSLSLDIFDNLSAYVGYTDIYQSQQTQLGPDLKMLPAITGANWEGGLKWAPRGGRLNASVALYRIRKKGFGSFDDSYVVKDSSGNWAYFPDAKYGFMVQAANGNRYDSGFVDPLHQCCYKILDNAIYKSDGVDTEVTGEIAKGWQISANLTYNSNKFDGSFYGASQGMPLVSIAPKWLYKVWASVDLRAAGITGWASGFTLSAGVNGQSAGYQRGGVCVNPAPIVQGSTSSLCTTYSPPDYIDYEFTVAPYYVASARVDYRFSDKISASLNVENLLDKTYVGTTGSVYGGNWYGQPRSLTFSLRTKW
jgi:outer-membrane receptor for ferric coprogen and ferric-rhodotorulic acid